MNSIIPVEGRAKRNRTFSAQFAKVIVSNTTAVLKGRYYKQYSAEVYSRLLQ